MWASAITNGIAGIIGSIIGNKTNDEYQTYTPQKDNTGIYLAIAAIIVILIVIILIARKK